MPHQWGYIPENFFPGNNHKQNNCRVSKQNACDSHRIPDFFYGEKDIDGTRLPHWFRYNLVRLLNANAIVREKKEQRY